MPYHYGKKKKKEEKEKEEKINGKSSIYKRYY